jgi:ferredoxin--NADP+ reductase
MEKVMVDDVIYQQIIVYGGIHMYKIMKKELLAPNIYLMDIHAPRVAKSCYPGQFVIIKIDEKGERIPLTICDYDREAGTVTIVFQTVGFSTKKMAEYEVGESYRDFIGPLGVKSELVEEAAEELAKKKILFVAGGVGTAPVYPQVKWMKEQGYDVDCIIGARNKDLIILEDAMKQVAKNVYVATDDGSYGFKGNVNDCIKDLIHNQGKEYNLVIAIGPIIMMKFVSILTKELGIPTVVSMNPIMVDGTGMCGGCRLTVGNEVKFACVDGPEFDGHLVDFDESIKRQQMYKTAEGRALLKEKEGATHKNGGCGCSDNA